MGGDGQALANKRSLLQRSRVYATAADLDSDESKEKTTQRSRTLERWSHCALSMQALEAPLVFDAAGDVFSKQSVLDYLLARKKCGDGALEQDSTSIKKLTDVREITNDVNSDGSVCCPITGYSTASGVHSFIGFWGCGHVVSASTLKKSEDSKSQIDVECPLCGLSSFYARLICEDADDAKNQRKYLRHSLKKIRKRVREEDLD